jgi:hypothetical protein
VGQYHISGEVVNLSNRTILYPKVIQTKVARLIQIHKCKPDPITGKCLQQFSRNVHDNWFSSGKCPPGFGRHDNDERGKCFPKPIRYPPGFFPKHGGCTKDIFINIQNVIHESSGSHNLSSGCFDTLNVAWLEKIERSQSQEVDNLIDMMVDIGEGSRVNAQESVTRP